MLDQRDEIARPVNLSGFDSPPLAASVSPERGNTPRFAAGLFIGTDFEHRPFDLETAVERCVQCVPLGARQGAMKEDELAIPTRGYAAELEEGTHCTHCRALTHQVTSVAAHPLRSTHTFHPSLGGQLPLLGSTLT